MSLSFCFLVKHSSVSAFFRIFDRCVICYTLQISRFLTNKQNKIAINIEIIRLYYV
nr:MAG TPA: hypothetical protein [Caudoviricetes sp.]